METQEALLLIGYLVIAFILCIRWMNKYLWPRIGQQPPIDCLDSQEFDDLMSCYRITDMSDQDLVIHRFEAVKKWLRENYK